VLSTATFVGYLVDGLPGALAATAGIFLPAFLLVGFVNPYIARLRSSTWLASFLDAVNASAVALMAAVTLDLGSQVLVSMDAILIALLASLAVLRFKVGPVWVVLGGALIGALLAWLL
jgi:chromate transporter